MTSATRAFHVTFTFFHVNTDCMTRSTSRFSCRLIVRHIPLGCVRKKTQKRITEISNIRLRPPCLTSSCRGNGLICAFNNFNQPCKCGGSCTEQKSGEAERKKQTETESGEHLRGSVVYNNLVWARVFDTYTVKTLNSKLKLKQKRLRYNRCHS